MVCLVEFLKLGLTIPVVMARFSYNSIQWPSKEDSFLAMRLMIVPAMAYSMNNGIIYFCISRIDFSSLSVWRQLTPLFVAGIWIVLFRRQLGTQRWLALLLLVGGTALNSYGHVTDVRWNMVAIVLFSCLTT